MRRVDSALEGAPDAGRARLAGGGGTTRDQSLAGWHSHDSMDVSLVNRELVMVREAWRINSWM